MEVVVNDKKVVLRDHLTLEEGYELFGYVIQGNYRDLSTQLPLLTSMIESWEFDGDPKDENSYKKLDLFREAVPLIREVNDFVNSMMAPEESKN